MKKFPIIMIAMALSISLLTACDSNSENNNPIATNNNAIVAGNDDSQPTQTTANETYTIIFEASDNATLYWNEVISQVRDYSETGLGSSGQVIDMDFIISDMNRFYSPLANDKESIDGLGDEYSSLINAYDHMYDEAVIINDYLQQNTPEPNSELPIADDITLFRQYFYSFYDQASEIMADINNQAN